MMRVDVVTIFPEYLAPLELSLVGRARAAGLLDIAVHDLRTWTHDVHRTVDDSPYGGGPGMVMRAEPWGAALDALAGTASRLVVPTPAGVPFTQSLAADLAGAAGMSAGANLGGGAANLGGGGANLGGGGANSGGGAAHLIFACGRYEGIDERVLDHARTRMPVTEVSLGDYVLFGGEVAVLVIMEAVTRLLPGVLGNAESLADESYAHGLLEAPVYTKPATWRGHDVPEVLRSGDHARIRRWRRDRALLRTAARRPDLLATLPAGTLDRRDLDALRQGGFQLTDLDVAK